MLDIVRITVTSLNYLPTLILPWILLTDYLGLLFWWLPAILAWCTPTQTDWSHCRGSGRGFCWDLPSAESLCYRIYPSIHQPDGISTAIGEKNKMHSLHLYPRKYYMKWVQRKTTIHYIWNLCQVYWVRFVKKLQTTRIP